MTKIHLILYLTTTLSFALLAAGNGFCTNQHPFAYDNGNRCCKTNWENPGKQTECQGRMLNISSTCCDGENVACWRKPCKNYGGCISQGCKNFMKLTYEFMDSTEDPCNNFYQYACGDFEKNLKKIPDGHSAYYASFGGVADIIFNNTNKILNEIPTKQTKFKSDTLAYNHHQSCMDEQKIEGLQFSPLLKILRKYGGFPVVIGPHWGGQQYDVWEHVKILVENGINPNNLLLSFNVDIDEMDSRRKVFTLDQAELPVISLAYGIDAYVAVEYQYMVDAVKLMGAKNDSAYTEMKDVMQFQKELANIMTTKRTDLKKFYNKKTLGDLEGQPGYPPSTLNYIKSLLGSAGASRGMVDWNTEVIVKNLNYAQKLDAIFRRTPKRTLANYLSWRAYHEVAEYLHKDSRMAYFKYKTTLWGHGAPWPRWKQCILDLGTLIPSKKPHSLSPLLTSLYARNHFRPDKLKRPIQIVDEVTKSFRSILKNLDWMDPQTHAQAIKKIDNMGKIVAYTDDILKPEVVDEFFKGLNMDTGTFFENNMRLKLFWMRTNYESILPGLPTNLNTNIPILMVNAYYTNKKNVMMYSLGIFDRIFYDADLPHIMNLPNIGMVTGHEILHGFDTKGRLYDFEGSMKNWWQNSTAQEFKKRTDCMIKQYGNYTHPQVNKTLNGKNTLNENIADNSGFIAAYKAFEKVKDPNNPFLVDGLYFTEDQWFFLKFAHMFCSKYFDATLRHTMAFEAHPPGRFRVNGVVSNHPSFAKAFRCPLGSPMNPVKKCRVW